MVEYFYYVSFDMISDIFCNIALTIKLNTDYGYIKSHESNIIVHPNFNTKRRWTKETNFGGENNRTGCLKLAWFIMPLAGVESRKRMVTGIDILIGSSWQG